LIFKKIQFKLVIGMFTEDNMII